MILEALIAPLKLDMKDFNSGLDDARKKGSNLLSGLSAVGGGLVSAGLAGLTTVVAGVGTAIGFSAKKTFEWAGKLDSISDVLGTTSKDSAGFALLTERVGSNVEFLNGSMSKMVNGLLDAKGELGTTGKAIQGLGIDVKDANGNIRPANDLFAEIATKINSMPEGLNKTSALMDIFGKSGAEMGDILAAAADGGLASFTEEADKLGLSMGDDKVKNVIDFQKNMEKVKQTLQGAGVSIFSQFLPGISQLSDKFATWLQSPVVQNGIKDVGKDIGEISKKVADFVNQYVVPNIPVAIGKFKEIVDFLRNNKPVMVGILAALGVAFLAFGVTVATAAWTALSPLLPIIAVMALVGAIAYVVYRAWTENWGGIQDKVKAVWDVLQPILQSIKAWMQTNIPKAVAFAKNAFDNVATAISNVVGWFKQAIDWLSQLKEKLMNLEIPDWLTPGSPTPFEIGLMGINRALKDLNHTPFPEMMTLGNEGGQSGYVSSFNMYGGTFQVQGDGQFANNALKRYRR